MNFTLTVEERYPVLHVLSRASLKNAYYGNHGDCGLVVAAAPNPKAIDAALRLLGSDPQWRIVDVPPQWLYENLPTRSG